MITVKLNDTADIILFDIKASHHFIIEPELHDEEWYSSLAPNSRVLAIEGGIIPVVMSSGTLLVFTSPIYEEYRASRAIQRINSFIKTRNGHRYLGGNRPTAPTPMQEGDILTCYLEDKEKPIARIKLKLVKGYMDILDYNFRAVLRDANKRNAK